MFCLGLRVLGQAQIQKKSSITVETYTPSKSKIMYQKNRYREISNVETSQSKFVQKKEQKPQCYKSLIPKILGLI